MNLKHDKNRNYILNPMILTLQCVDGVYRTFDVNMNTVATGDEQVLMNEVTTNDLYMAHYDGSKLTNAYRLNEAPKEEYFTYDYKE